MNKHIIHMAVVAAITLIGTTSIPATAAEISTNTRPAINYKIIPTEKQVGDIKLLLNNKMKYLYADNDTKKVDILEQVKFLVNNNNHYLSIDVTSFNIIPSTIDKEGTATGNFVISDSRNANSQIILPFNIPVQCLNTDEEKALKDKVTKVIDSMDISNKIDYKEMQEAVTEGLADDSISVKVSDVYNSPSDWYLSNYRVFIYLSNKDKTIDTEFCAKGYNYPTLKATETLKNIAYQFDESWKNIYVKDLNKESAQNIADKLFKGTSITAKISDYIQIPVTDTTYGEVLFSITFTDSRDNSTVTKYFDAATDEPKTINNNQQYKDYMFGITMVIAKYSASNNTTLSDIERAISGSIQSEYLTKRIEGYSFKPATTSSEGLIDLPISITGYGEQDGYTLAGYNISIPKLTE